MERSGARRSAMDPDEDFSPGDHYRPFARMQNVYDKLLLLDFEHDFLRMTRLRPFHRLYFMCPTNPGEQFFNFVSLSTWLMRKCGIETEMPQESDDPNVLVGVILDTVKSMGGVIDFNPGRVKSGCGPDVVTVLDYLTDRALVVVQHEWKPPVVLKEQKESEEVDEDDQEINLEKIEEEMEAYYSSEGEDDDLVWVQGSASSAAGDVSQADGAAKMLLTDVVDAEQWRLEVERVLPQLKITIQQDAQDWRQRQEKMKQFSEEVNDVVRQLENPMENMIAEAKSAVEKIKTREGFVNDHFEALLMELSVTQDNVATTKDKHKELSTQLTARNRSMTRLNDELDTIRRQLDDRGSVMADGAPVAATKKAISGLNKEIGDLEVEIGVMEHCLLKSMTQEQMAQRERPT